MKNLSFIAFLLFIVNSSITQEPWFAKINNPTRVDFPLLIDSAYIDNIFTQDYEIGDKQLHADDLLFLCPGYDTLKKSPDFFMLKRFLFIDSLKANDLYKNYIDNEINLGMVRVSEAFEIEHIKLNNNSSVFLWGLFHESYEACPYSSGYYVIGTIIYKNKAVSINVFGEEESTGDEPYWWEETTKSKIYGNAIEIETKMGEGDEETEHFSYPQTTEYLLIEGHLIKKAIRK